MIILESNFVKVPHDTIPDALVVLGETIFRDEFKDHLYYTYYESLEIKQGSTMKIVSNTRHGKNRLVELVTIKPIGFAGKEKTDIFGYVILNIPSGYRTDGWKV